MNIHGTLVFKVPTDALMPITVNYIEFQAVDGVRFTVDPEEWSYYSYKSEADRTVTINFNWESLRYAVYDTGDSTEYTEAVDTMPKGLFVTDIRRCTPITIDVLFQDGTIRKDIRMKSFDFYFDYGTTYIRHFTKESGRHNPQLTVDGCKIKEK